MTDSVTLARFIRNQVALADRPPPGCIQLNNDEALVCASALEQWQPSLEDKVALMLHYCVELQHHRMTRDNRAFESLMDDAEVAAWLDKMNKAGRIKNTRFTRE